VIGPNLDRCLPEATVTAAITLGDYVGVTKNHAEVLDPDDGLRNVLSKS
jgi:hypothetical protein